MSPARYGSTTVRARPRTPRPQQRRSQDYSGGLLKSDKILKATIHLLFAIPPQSLLNRVGRPRWHFSMLSMVLTLAHWLAYSFEMHIASRYWLSGHSPGLPTIPTETMILLTSLMFSSALTYTLFMVYLYHPRHTFIQAGEEALVPHFEFKPQGRQEDMEPWSNHWLNTNVALLIGFLGVGFVIICDFPLHTFFDFLGIHEFLNHTNTTNLDKNVYPPSIAFIYYGFFSVVSACCVFYIMCLDIIRHVDFTEYLIVTHSRDFYTAKHFHECLLKYTEDLMGTVKWWFIIHTFFFVFITLSIIAMWIVSTEHFPKHHTLEYITAELAGSLLIAFKYAFPFVAASRVTSRFDKMYQRVNKDCSPRDFHEVDVFMSYCRRCRAGFTVFGVRITAKLALASLLCCFSGFFKLFRDIANDTPSSAGQCSCA